MNEYEHIKGISPIASVERSVSVLNSFIENSGIQTLSEIAACTGILKTTVFRILFTLCKCGYIVKRPDGKYQLSAIYLRFSLTYKNSLNLFEKIKPSLEKLVSISGESASFYIRQAEHRMCLIRVDSPHPVRDVAPEGAVKEIDDTAASQVLRDYIDIDAGAIVWDDNAYRATYGKGNTPQVSSISAPVFDIDGLVGAISISGPKERLTEKNILSIKNYLLEEAKSITKILTGQMI